jgi:hypothetical protein
MNSHTQGPAATVRSSTVVDARLERAFDLFVHQFDRIKPRDHNLLRVDIAESVSSRAQAVTSTTGGWTAATAGGHGCWLTSRRTGSW